MTRRTVEHLICGEQGFIHESARILVLDDEALVTRFVTSCLRKAGFTEVRSLEDPLQIVPELITFHPDLLLLDISMPQANGIEILETIRSNPEWNDLIVVMLSAATKGEKYKALRLGANDFIDKPVSGPTLIERVGLALRIV